MDLLTHPAHVAILWRVYVKVSSTKHFVYLPAERLYRILSDDCLNVQGELEVFCALLQWLDFDREDRLCMAPKLLQCCVRLQFIPPEQIITKVEPVDWLFQNPDCEFLVNEAIRSVENLRRYARLDTVSLKVAQKWSC